MFTVILTLVAIYLLVKPNTAQYIYETLSTDSSQLPEGRYAMGWGQKTSANDGKIYLFGGIGNGYSTRSDVLLFDFYNNKQISILTNVNSPCGIENWNQCCVNFNDKTYMTHWSVSASSDPNCNKFLWIFDYATNQFDFTANNPEGHVLQPCVALDKMNERIFFTGHFDATDNDIPYSYPAKRMQIYHINNNTWKRVPDTGSMGQYCSWLNATHSYCIHQQRSSHTCMYDDNTDRLWIFGGRDAQYSDKLSSVEYFDFKTSLWIKNNAPNGYMKVPRAWARMTSFVHFDGKVYWIIFGGQGESPGAGYLIDEIEIFDPSNGQFVNISQTVDYKMIHKRSKFGIGQHKNKIFLFGGGSSPYDEVSFKWDVFTNNSNDIYVVTSPPTNIPTTSPTQFTINPSSNPTVAPTASTITPTHTPTYSTSTPTTTNPSLNPTTNPNTDPTSAPTINPSLTPTTTNPSSNPSSSPNTDPTSSPTTNPSLPSTSPLNPTKDPTRNPIKYPIATVEESSANRISIGLILIAVIIVTTT